MCDVCRDAHAEAALLLAEQHLLADDTGFQGATRDLNDAERRSRIDFRKLDTLEQTAVNAAREALEALRDVAVREIVSAVTQGEFADARSLVVAAERLTSEVPPAVKRQAATVASLLRELYSETYASARSQAVQEARAQGVPDERADAGEPTEDTSGSLPFAVAAASVALTPWQRLMETYRRQFTTGAMMVAGGVLASDLTKRLRNVSMDGAVDEARQGVHQAIGAGRVDAAQAIGPSAIWASELLDGKTCGSCAVVDGQEYPDIQSARDDYPLGGYRLCKGGPRCRGTLVFEYRGDEPGPTEPPPSVLDDLPKGPKTPPPAQPVTTPSLQSDPRELAQPGRPHNDVKRSAPKRKKGRGQLYDDWGQVDVEPTLREKTPIELARGTNPRHNVTSKVYGNNCTSTVTAYEARARGLNVEAGRAPSGTGRSEVDWLQFYQTADGRTPTLDRFDSAAAVRDAIDSGPPNARYVIQQTWKTGGSHVYIADRRDGVTHFVEPQSPTAPDASTHLDRAKVGRAMGGRNVTIGLVRVDDKVLTNRALETVERNPANWLTEITKAEAKQYSTLGQMSSSGEYIVPKVRAVGSTWEIVPETERLDVARRLNEGERAKRQAHSDLLARKITMPQYREATAAHQALLNEVVRWRIR